MDKGKGSITNKEIRKDLGQTTNYVNVHVLPNIRKIGHGRYCLESYQAWKRETTDHKKATSTTSKPRQPTSLDELAQLERHPVSRRSLIEKMKIDMDGFLKVLYACRLEKRIGYTHAESDTILEVWQQMQDTGAPSAARSPEEPLHPDIFHIGTSPARKPERVVLMVEIPRTALADTIATLSRSMGGVS